MKKRLALVVAAATALAGLGSLAAFADTINTPYGNVNIDPHSAIWFDGAESNPAPLSGYLVIHANGQVSCGATDGPDAGHTPQNLFIENGCNVMSMLPDAAQVAGGPGVMIPNLPELPDLPDTPAIPGFTWPSTIPAGQLPVLPKLPGATIKLKNVPKMGGTPAVELKLHNVPNVPIKLKNAPKMTGTPGAGVKLHDVPTVASLAKGLPAVPSGARILGAVPSASDIMSNVPAVGTTVPAVGTPGLPSTTGIVSTVTNTLSTVTSALPVHLPSI